MRATEEFGTAIAGLPVGFPIKSTTTVYLALLLITLVISGLHLLHTGVLWTLADWLINYQGGFVRRGLLGEAAFHIHSTFHVPLLSLILFISVSAYIIFFVAVWWLIQSLKWNYWFLLLLFSPVTMQFPLVSTSSYHKEILLFAVFAVLLTLLRNHVRGSIIAAYLTLSAVACVLTHEPFVVYAPYVVVAVYLFIRDGRRVLKLLWLPFVCCSISLAAVVTHPGTAGASANICASLSDSSQNLCQGSIQYLTYSSHQAHTDVSETMHRFGYFCFYPGLTLLALIPFLGCYRSLCRHGLPLDIQKVFLLSTGSSILLSIPLFVYATDWGRWIEIHCMLLFLLFITAALLYANGDKAPESERIVNGRSFMATLALAIYSTCWSLPGYSSYPKGGWVSTVKRIVVRAKYNQIF